MGKSQKSIENKILDKAGVISRTVMSQQSFNFSENCNKNHRQILETIICAAIRYLPQSQELWTGNISIKALKKLSNSDTPYKINLTKDHHYPRKIAATELFKLEWSIYGRFNFVLQEENKYLVQHQKEKVFVSPKDSYRKAGISLTKISQEQLNRTKKGDRRIVELALSNHLES